MNPQEITSPSSTPANYLSGRVALITGGNHGVGLNIARSYLQAGANLMICSRNAASLEKAARGLASYGGAGQIVEYFQADISRQGETVKLMAATIERFSRLDILVNNAGIYGPIGLFESQDWEHWVEAININLLGSVLMARAVLPHFKANRYGKIIQLAGAGATFAEPRFSAYAVSKVGVVRFMHILAEECRGYHIDINSILPGRLDTHMLDELIEAGPERLGQENYERALRRKKKGGDNFDHAQELSVFLGSAQSDGITGKIISALWDPWKTFPSYADIMASSDVYTLGRIVPRERLLQLFKLSLQKHGVLKAVHHAILYLLRCYKK
ncbi:MAG: SDR family oxidoreductase [Gammaproteobacteria bacterium]|nr:SDR family oxidoreductase [Gammaproteobacteria bacterium]